MSETTTDTIREYHALVEFGEPGSVEKFVTDLVAELEALRARLRTTEQANSEMCRVHNGLLADGAKWQQRAEEVEARLRTTEQQLESGVRAIEVTQPNGEPLPAPCAIDGCHYDELAALDTRLAQLEQEMRGWSATATDEIAEIGGRDFVNKCADALHTARQER